MKRLSLLLVLLAVMFAFVGCAGEKNTEEGNTKLYYLNSSKTALVVERIDMTSTETNDAIAEMVTLLDRAPSDPTLKRPKGDVFMVQDWGLSDGILTLDLSSGYSSIDKIVEILVRAAIVKDFCQIEGVEAVNFYVGGRPLLNGHGEAVKNMKAEDFIDILNRNGSETKVISPTVFFATGNENEIAAVQVRIVAPIDKHIEDIILEQLISGPNEALVAEGFSATMPQDSKVNKIIIKNNICYIDMDYGFLRDTESISMETRVYSLVNSIISLPEINRVKLTVDGEEYKKITEFETEGFLIYNPGIIRE